MTFAEQLNKSLAEGFILHAIDRLVRGDVEAYQITILMLGELKR